VQDWLELGKGCSKAPRAKGEIIGIEIERDHAAHDCEINEF